MNITKARARSLIIEAFRNAPEIYSGFRRVIQDTLYDECHAAEKQHRRGHPAVAGFSVALAAQYFAVRYVRDYMLHADKMPNVGDYLHLRHECFTAAAIVRQYGFGRGSESKKLQDWIASIPPEFDAIDYPDMMK